MKYDRLLEKEPQKIIPPRHESIEYLTALDRDANGNFIDKNGKIITDITVSPKIRKILT